MPTFGTHTPDAPYVPGSDMAWGPRGHENMKSVQDREYEQAVRRRQRRCSVTPPPVRSHAYLYAAFEAVTFTTNVVSFVVWGFERYFALVRFVANAILGLGRGGEAGRRSSRGVGGPR
jgi:hypothetical protein